MLYRYLQRHLSSLVIATLCTFALGAVSALTFALVGPALQIITDSAGEQNVSLVKLFGDRLGGFAAWILNRDQIPAQELWRRLPLLIVITAFLRAGLSLLQWVIWERSSELVARDMRQDLIEGFLDLHPESRRGSFAEIDAELAAHLGTDIRVIREYLVHFFGGFPRELVQVFFYLITLFLLEPTLACFFMLGIGPAAILLSRLGHKLRRRSQTVLSNVSQLTEWLQQRLSGIETIKQFRTEDIERKHMLGLSARLFRDFVRAGRIKARTSPVLETVAVAAMMLVMSYAIEEIETGKLNSSILLSFFSVLGILSQSASKLGRYFNSNKEGEAALLRVERSMKLMSQGTSSVWQGEFNPRMENILEIKQLSYTYALANESALNDLNLTFKRGKIYAIAGPSGSGKSTLLKMILGLSRVQRGQLQYGVSSPLEIGYLPQSIQLMRASIAANIAYPESVWDVGRVHFALEQVKMKEFVLSLPDGIDSELNDAAVSLSGGQAQRIQLARLFYKNYSLIIIDEGTSALDPENEALVLSTLTQMLASGSTLIMVAHRIAALKVASELIVLKRGKIYFQGPPESVFKSDDWRALFDNEI